MYIYIYVCMYYKYINIKPCDCWSPKEHLDTIGLCSTEEIQIHSHMTLNLISHYQLIIYFCNTRIFNDWQFTAIQETMQTSPFILTTMGNPTWHFDVQTMDEYLAAFEQHSRPYHLNPFDMNSLISLRFFTSLQIPEISSHFGGDFPTKR